MVSRSTEAAESDYIEQQLEPRRRSSAGSFLVLHAALLERDGAVIALTGPSGIGKSTLSAGLQSLGWILRGDDTMTLHGGKGAPSALALASRLRLKADSASAVGGGDNVSRGVDSFGKHVFDLPEADFPRPVNAFFLLDVAADAEVGAERMGPSAACAVIVANSFARDPAHLEEAGRRLAFAAEVAAQVPLFRLRYPRDYGAIPDVAAEIARTLEGQSPAEET
ncbi:hypothetical protein [Citreimonas sp.]|uniref:hypothetical protein n=1 Tax=Citreimonas sp. TaxID=3036715 RepID=UPI004058AA4B